MGATPVRAGLFTTAGEPRLLGGRCEVCDRRHFPAAPTCPYCSADRVEPVELAPVGQLWAWTAVATAPPGYRGPVPFGVGVVEMPDGIRVVTRLTEADPARLRFGQSMRLVITPLHTDEQGDDVVTYAFAPEGA